MTAEIAADATGLNRRVGENVFTLMFRTGRTRAQLASASGMHEATLGRKLKGRGDWTVTEIERISRAAHVTPAELLGDLPTYDDWLPRLDSNQQPFD